MTTFNFIHLVTVLFSGLLAGLFYGYDCSVINGLGNLPDKEFLSAFQSINKAILNPYFFLTFMGNIALLPTVTVLSYKAAPGACFYLLVAASAVYIIAVFGITLFGNIPLNELLKRSDLPNSSTTTIRELRQKFEGRWNAYHHIRTYAAMLSFLLAIISITKK